MIYRLLDELAIRPRDTASLRTIVYGAAPITARRLRQGLDALGPVFLQIYGQTEAPNFLTTLAKRDHLRPELHGSCGQPVLLADIAIRRPDGALALPGEAGEVVARSPYTLERYHDDPERTAEAYDGAWLRTGDLGYLDEAGYLFLVDRAKDMIISGGMNVYSSEVENAVQEHPGVRQVVVIGVPHDDWGEAVHAVVVPAGGAGPPLTEAQLIAHCRDRLARYKVPKSVEFVDAVPVTAYGKPDKKALRARHWAGQERAVH
jgi:fatty-acyl-CoA synthase/long-chain acyl-CoA synthetase